MAIESENSVPKLVGGFNIPKAVIENKVDVLTFLEILVRKNIVTPQELDDIRGAVVAHLNAAYPDLQLSYNTPGAPIPPPAKPMNSAFVSAPPPVMQPVAAGAPPTNVTVPTGPDAIQASTATPPVAAPGASAPTSPASATPSPSAAQPGGANKPLYVQALPPKFVK
jgi:hypothetical protein